MKRVKFFSVWLIALMAISATTATLQAQSVNMSRYITLTVQSGQPIKLSFQAAAAGTPVRVVSGSNSTDVTVNATGGYWSPDRNFTSDGTTMIVYGDIIGFGCTNNGANLTALDASHNTELKTLDCFLNELTVLNISGCTRLKYLSCFKNRLTALDVSSCTGLLSLKCAHNELTALDVSACTQLEELDCSANNFSVAALNRLYCSLPDRTGETEKGKIYPAKDVTDAGHADVLASSGHIATGKNWEVWYLVISTDISTTGIETCGGSALDVAPGTLFFVADGETKPFNVTGSVNWTATSSEAWLTLAPAAGNGNGTVNATAAPNTGATRTATITVEEVGGSLTKTIAVTQAGSVNMSRYITLSVEHGQPIKLDFKAASAGTPVRVVSGSNTTDIVVGTSWSGSQNFTSDGTTMTVYGDINGFVCSLNNANLTAIDVSDNTELRSLDCSINSLTALDVSACTQLEELYCNANNFSVAALNRLYCSLPDRTGLTPKGKIVPVSSRNESGHANVLASSGSIATGKNWKVQYGSGGSDIPTTGSYTCGSPLLESTPATLSFAIAGGNLSLAVTANVAWTVTSSEPWLTLAPAAGRNDGVVNVTAAANPGIPRNATLTLSGGGLTRTIAVTQDGVPPAFSVTPSVLTFTAAGENKALTVTATQSWTAQCDASWLTLSALSGTGDSTITVTAPAYEDEWPRTAKIFFVSGTLKDTVTVTQNPKPGPDFLALDDTELTLPVGASQRLVVTAYPKDADIDRRVTWTSFNKTVATVSGNGTVTALSEGTAEIHVFAETGGQSTRCRVRVVPLTNMVSVTPAGEGKLQLALMALPETDFTLSFEVELPEGFALDAKKTAPDASLSDKYAVTVSGNRIEMKPSGLRVGMMPEKRELLTIGCTAVPGTSNGSYKGALRNLAFTPAAGYALQNVTVPFTFTYTVANETVDGLRVHAADGALHLTLPAAETVRIYNLSGSLVKTLALTAGNHVLPLPDGFYLVGIGTQVRKVMVK